MAVFKMKLTYMNRETPKSPTAIRMRLRRAALSAALSFGGVFCEVTAHLFGHGRNVGDCVADKAGRGNPSKARKSPYARVPAESLKLCPAWLISG